MAFCFAIAFACLPSLQIHVTYARIFSYLIAYILSYFAVRIALTYGRSPIAWLAFAVLVGVAYHIFQAAAFVGLVFVLAALINLPEDDLRANLKKVAILTVALAGVVIVSTAAYRIVLYLLGEHASSRTRVSLGLIDGQLSVLGHLHPSRALNVFEMWSYIYPLPALSSWTHKLIFILAAVLIALAISARYFFAGRKKSDLLVIAVGFVLFLGSLLPVVMDSFSRRQHLYVAPQAIMLLLLFWSLSAFRRGTLVLVAATALAVVSTAIAFPRKLVFPELAARQYVEKAILEGSAPHDSVRIIVVTNKQPPCRVEPCTGFFGRDQASLRRENTDLFANIATALDRDLVKVARVSPSEAKQAIEKAREKPEKVIVVRIKEASRWYRKTYE